MLAGAEHDERPLTLLVHVPKCAGSTVEAFVRKTFPERTLYPLRRRAPWRYVSRYYDFPADRDPSHIDFIVGHYFGRSIVRHFPGRSHRSAVLLRDPVEQILSHYNYRMQRYTDDGQNVIPFELWYRSRPCNPITEFLLQRYLEISAARFRLMSDASRLEIAAELLDSFWFVGRHTQCGELITRIAEEHGLSPHFERVNTTRAYFVSIDDLSARMREKLHRDTALDRALFAHFQRPDAARPADRGGRIRMLLKDLQRPSSHCAYRLVRANALPTWLYPRAQNARLSPGRTKRMRIAKALCLGLAAFLTVAYILWPNDIIPDGHAYGRLDDATVTMVLAAMSSVVMVL